MTSTTWASPRYVQELATILGPQNRIQESCDHYPVEKAPVYTPSQKYCELENTSKLHRLAQF